MSLYHKFKNVFDALPNVRTIWVDANGHHYLSPKSGCEKVDREYPKEIAKEITNVVEEVIPTVPDEVAKPNKKKNKK